MDEDFESSDEELELNDLKQLTAVLEADTDVPSESHSCSNWNGGSTTVPISTKSSSLNNIESALALNNLYHDKLRRLENLLISRLRECRRSLEETQGVINKIAKCNHKPDLFRYVHCGKPYFKDKLGFPAPENEDTLMIKTQMYDFSLASNVPGWTVKDKSNFMNAILKMSKDLIKNELTSKIQQLKKATSQPNSISEKTITALLREMVKVDKKPLDQLARPISEDYNWEELANSLGGRHTAREYQALWKLFFHPTINKNSWSKGEHNALVTIAAANNYQDWDLIAKTLNTGRTGYQCFVYHRTNMTSTFSGRRWTLEETTYLKRLIDYFQEDNYIPWGKIAAAMGNRTKIQIYNKYLRLMELRKGRFLPQEDAVILNCVQKFGENYKRMTNYLPGRSMIQIRSRYKVLNKMRISTIWSVEDDRKLMQIMTNQDSTRNFSIATKFFPGKNRVNIRSRYIILLKWMKNNPYMALKFAPRRGARRLNHGYASDDLNQALENLKNVLNNEVATKVAKPKLGPNSPEIAIDDAIVANLITEMFQKGEHSETAEASTSDERDVNICNLKRCLVFLHSKLNYNIFKESRYASLYPELNESVSTAVQMKSYSRKNKTNTVVVKETPEIWGRTTWDPKSYVFPPNYDTITGCKAIMQHVSQNLPLCVSGVDIHTLARRNPLVKQQLSNLLERFYTLFLWPMLLSNEKPGDLENLNNSCFLSVPESSTQPTDEPDDDESEEMIESVTDDCQQK